MAEPGWTPRFISAEVPLRGGIYRCLRPERLAEFTPFLAHYRRVRESDGYRRQDAAYYRALPDADPRDPQAATWRIRRETFRNLRRSVLPAGRGGLRVLDLGAGNGWLCHQLTALGHACVAVDVLDDAEDGLGAARHYPTPFTCVQADFNELPFAPGQFDLAIFNASLHYSPDPVWTVQLAREALVEGGILVVMDSPVFTDDEAGRRMIAEQQASFGVRGEVPVQAGDGYLTVDGLRSAASEAGLTVRGIPSRGSASWALRRWLAGRRLGREPARFGVWFGAWRPVSS